MKKNFGRIISATLIILAMYHLVVFLIPFVHTDVFWAAYGFTLAAFATAFVALYIAFVRKPSARSQFYGFPLARLGTGYLGIQVVAGLVVMALALWLPLWPVLLMFGLLLCAALLGLISTDTVASEINRQDVTLRRNTTLMRDLQSRIMQMSAHCTLPEAQKELKALAEELRYSDPVSSEALAEAEGELTAAVDELQQAIADGDAAIVRQLCTRASGLLAERNRLCKLNKA